MEVCPCSDKVSGDLPCPKKFTAAEIFEIRLERKKMVPADEYSTRLKDLIGAKERLAQQVSKKQPKLRVKDKMVCLSGYCIVMGLSESSGE